MSRCNVVSHHVLHSATAPSPRVHAAAIAITGNGPASAAIGTAISMHAKKPALSG
jgi:hypothetical protein